MLTAFLEIDVPVIAAINGPPVSHSELPPLSNVVLAADHTVFRDATHFVDGIPPGTGCTFRPTEDSRRSKHRS
jgi:enoyl-CoA hydratase/carnithine racemase